MPRLYKKEKPMQLWIDGQLCAFIDIKDFRTAHNLPDTFGVAHFQPKDFFGLGRIDEGGRSLNHLREEVLADIPARLNADELLDFYDRLQFLFRLRLYEVNKDIGLSNDEVEFAVSGFGDMNHVVMYALLRAKATGEPPTAFKTLYHDWVAQSGRVSAQQYPYEHDGALWQVRVVSYIYGRCGLRVDVGPTTHYLRDMVYVCPAEGFMAALLGDISARVTQALYS